MIFVFKTSVKTKTQAKKLKPHLDNLLPKAKWNFDLTDSDKVLRVDSEEDVILKITSVLTMHNYRCEELD